jgi:hypothetical protein
MRSTPIRTYDPRTFIWSGMELRQTGTKPGFPIRIEHRKVGSQWWDTNSSESSHTQQVWDTIVAEGTVK